jgi:hypothetical protein
MPPTKPRSWLSHFSSQLYRLMLLAYPPDLRNEFGGEIAEAFDVQLSDNWRTKRVSGVIGVWTRAIQEFITIAVVFRLGLLVVPCISTAITATVFLGLMMTTIPLIPNSAGSAKPQPILITRLGGEDSALARAAHTSR